MLTGGCFLSSMLQLPLNIDLAFSACWNWLKTFATYTGSLSTLTTYMSAQEFFLTARKATDEDESLHGHSLRCRSWTSTWRRICCIVIRVLLRTYSPSSSSLLVVKCPSSFRFVALYWKTSSCARLTFVLPETYVCQANTSGCDGWIAMSK